MSRHAVEAKQSLKDKPEPSVAFVPLDKESSIKTLEICIYGDKNLLDKANLSKQLTLLNQNNSERTFNIKVSEEDAVSTHKPPLSMHFVPKTPLKGDIVIILFDLTLDEKHLLQDMKDLIKAKYLDVLLKKWVGIRLDSEDPSKIHLYQLRIKKHGLGKKRLIENEVSLDLFLQNLIDGYLEHSRMNNELDIGYEKLGL